MADHPDAIEQNGDHGDEADRRAPVDLSAPVTGLDLLFSNLAAVDNHGKALPVDIPFEPIDEPLCPSPTAPVLEQDSSNPSVEDTAAVPVAKKSAREALAAKDAAESLPEFAMVDALLRQVAEHLGRSGPWHQRFIGLEEVFTRTNLELQGIHDVRWLSQGDAILRAVEVFPALIVMLYEWDSSLYELATSYMFHFLLYFLADVLEQLNVLNRAFQQRELDIASVHGQIRRSISFLESRYVDCGDDFGGGVSARLSPFIKKHGPEGGNPKTLVRNLSTRFKDLDSLVGVRLFMPDKWEPGRAERHRQCLEWLESLVRLFKAQDTDYIIPGVDKWRAIKELRAFCPILAGNVAAPPAREGEGSGSKGKVALEEEELEEGEAPGRDDDDRQASSDDDY
ncbi:unnamed protein product [Closterium sp. Naga37s-1]|nr:unnamed protein product [Closterium sp. Naga37s-1]